MEKLKDIEKLKVEYNSLILKNTKLKEKNAEMEIKVKKDFLDPAKLEIKRHQEEVEADLAAKKEKQETELTKKELDQTERENKLAQVKKELAEAELEIKQRERDILIQEKVLDQREKAVEAVEAEQEKIGEELAEGELGIKEFNKEVKGFEKIKAEVEGQTMDNQKKEKELENIEDTIIEKMDALQARENQVIEMENQLKLKEKALKMKFGLKNLNKIK